MKWWVCGAWDITVQYFRRNEIRRANGQSFLLSSQTAMETRVLRGMSCQIAHPVVSFKKWQLKPTEFIYLPSFILCLTSLCYWIFLSRTAVISHCKMTGFWSFWCAHVQIVSLNLWCLSSALCTWGLKIRSDNIYSILMILFLRVWQCWVW